MPEVTAKYRGYQTMEAKEHPDVKKANANDLTSDVSIEIRQKFFQKLVVIYVFNIFKLVRR